MRGNLSKGDWGFRESAANEEPWHSEGRVKFKALLASCRSLEEGHGRSSGSRVLQFWHDLLPA